jgi:D-arabinan exo alpha-(1,3)/(1,5)-arabinofuranosidase (non-reducing end)
MCRLIQYFKISLILIISSCSSNLTNEEKVDSFSIGSASILYKAPNQTVQTRWVSPENPTGDKGKGGLINKGAKGNAFYIVQPGETQIILDVKGAGIIQRMWMSGTIARNAEQRRAVKLEMYWEGHKKPAVEVPISDFFGNGLGVMSAFDSELFSSPEGRSFNFTIPMPFRKAAKIQIVNESSSQVLFWYDINYLKVDKIPDDAMYFHAYWSRTLKTELGKDFEILPKVEGTGRYLGTNVGVIGNEHYKGTWFGEGEVKVYLDGDNNLPTLVGTGTEDYVGTGWGQGVYKGQRFGSLVFNDEWDIYSFYRYHTADAVYFHEDCKVTIQQIGNAVVDKMREIRNNGGELIPVWGLKTYDQNMLNAKKEPMEHVWLLDMDPQPDLMDEDFPFEWGNFYRSDDVSATAYFYLNKPVNNLPKLAPVEIRLKDLQEKVWDKLN